MERNIRIRKSILALFVFVLVLSFGNMITFAASKNSLKNVKGISWDLKKNKKIKFHTYYIGVGPRNETMKITSLKIKKAGKKNYNTATIKIEFDERWNVSSFLVDKFLYTSHQKGYGGAYGAPVFVFVVDYNTGMDLSSKNKHKVTVKESDWKVSGTKSYYGAWETKNGQLGRNSIELSKLSKTLTITYPSKYDGLCILAGGCTRLAKDLTSNDNKFMEGKAPFRKATGLYSRSDKKYCHGLRITA